MKYILFLLTTLLVTACSTTGVAIPLGDATHAPTAIASIEILGAAPKRPYVDIALVDGIAATDDYFTQERTQAAALNALKEAAAKVGANAVIVTARANRSYGGLWEKIQISGNAIRYTDVD